MESIARIRVRSKQQAMDWALVLVSQGIESRIQTSPEESEWWLEITPADVPRAADALRKYRKENRRWHWPPTSVYQGLLFDWSALSWIVLIFVFYWASTQIPVFRDSGAMDSSAVSSGQWWRLCTAIWLHADGAHLASNASIGFVMLGLTLGLYGTGPGMLAAYLAGIGGNLLALWTATETHRSLGASGLVMGCIGLLAGQSLFGKGTHRIKLLATTIGGAVMLFALLGLSPGTDVVAHAGGAGSGLLIGAMLSLLGLKPDHSRANSVCATVFALLTALPWLFALLVGR